MANYNFVELLIFIGKDEYELFFEFAERKIIIVSNATLNYAELFRNLNNYEIEQEILKQSKITDKKKKKLLRDRRSDLYICLKKFLFIKYCINQIEKPSSNEFVMFEDYMIGEILMKNKLDNLYAKHFASKLSLPEDVSLKSSIEKIIYFLAEISNDIHTRSTNADLKSRNRNLDIAIQILDKMYWTERLKLECENLNRKNVLQLSSDAISVYQVIESNEVLKSFILKDKVNNAYYHIYSMLKENNETSYNNVYDNINQYLGIEDTLEKSNIFNYMLNFCVRKVNLNEHTYCKKYLELIEKMNENKLVLTSNIMEVDKYKSIIDMCLLSGNSSLAKYYLNLYEPFLPNEMGKKYFDFNDLNIKFFEASNLENEDNQKKEELKLLIKDLNQTVKLIPSYEITCRKLIVKCCFIVEKLENSYNYERTEYTAVNLRRLLESKSSKVGISPYQPLIDLMKIIVKYIKYPDKRATFKNELGQIDGSITDIDWFIKTIS